MSDNVINLPTSGNKDLQIAEAQPPANNELVLELIEKNRRKGLDVLEKRLDSLEDRKTLKDPELESVVRDLTRGASGAHTSLQALNSMTDFMKHDLIACIQNVEQAARAQWQMSAHMQVVVNLLKEKKIVTEEELKSEWTKVAQQTKEHLEAQHQEAAKEAPIEEPKAEE